MQLLAQAEPEAGTLLAGSLCYLIVLVPIIAVFGALILWASISVFNRMSGGSGVAEPTFGGAYVMALASSAGGFVIQMATGAVLGADGLEKLGALAAVLNLGISFLILAGIVSVMLPSSFPQGLGIAALYFAIVFAIALTLGALLFAFAALGGG